MKFRILTISVLLATLGLPSLVNAAEKDDLDFKCKKELVESYNLSGYSVPRQVSMFVCPQLRSSCCSLYDQFLIFTNWRDKIKPKLLEYYDSYNAKLQQLKPLVSEVMKIDFPKMIDDLQLSDKVKEGLLATYLRLNQTSTDSMIEEVIIMQKDSANFMLDLRSSFYCSICDFESHKAFDIDRKTFALSVNACGDIALNTINFSYYMTVKLGGFLQSLSQLMYAFALNHAEKPVKIKLYYRLSRQIKKCSKLISNRSPTLKGCSEYCQHWKINANSPVMEGYHVFINEMNSSLAKFIKDHGKEGRLLEENSPKKELDTGSARPPAEKKKARANFNLIENDKEERKLKERLLNGENEWFFDPTDAVGMQDPYDDSRIDPNFDEFTLNRMFNTVEDYEHERNVGYARFIASKIGQIDTELDNDKESEDEIFKTNTGTITDLENYSTLVLGKGFDVSKHLRNNNINTSIQELVFNLKKKSKFPILYEKIDPSLLNMANGIVNEDVSGFHRDNFLDFRDFSLDLKKYEVAAKMNASS